FLRARLRGDADFVAEHRARALRRRRRRRARARGGRIEQEEDGRLDGARASGHVRILALCGVPFLGGAGDEREGRDRESREESGTHALGVIKCHTWTPLPDYMDLRMVNPAIWAIDGPP